MFAVVYVWFFVFLVILSLFLCGLYWHGARDNFGLRFACIAHIVSLKRKACIFSALKKRIPKLSEIHFIRN